MQGIYKKNLSSFVLHKIFGTITVYRLVTLVCLVIWRMRPIDFVAHGSMIPAKWTAPEALNYRLKYSTASDVWS